MLRFIDVNEPNLLKKENTLQGSCQDNFDL